MNHPKGGERESIEKNLGSWFRFRVPGPDLGSRFRVPCPTQSPGSRFSDHPYPMYRMSSCFECSTRLPTLSTSKLLTLSKISTVNFGENGYLSEITEVTCNFGVLKRPSRYTMPNFVCSLGNICIVHTVLIFEYFMFYLIYCFGFICKHLSPHPIMCVQGVS